MRYIDIAFLICNQINLIFSIQDELRRGYKVSSVLSHKGIESLPQTEIF